MNSRKSLGLVDTGSKNKDIKILRSNDLDETRLLVASVFCEHKLLIRSNALLDYSHEHFNIDTISLSNMSYGAYVNIKPGSLESFYLIQLPIEGNDLTCINGVEHFSDKSNGTVHSPQESLEMSWSHDCRKLVVKIDKDALERHAANIFGCSIPGQLRFAADMNLMQPSGIAWSGAIQHLYAEIQSAPQLFNLPLIRSQLEQNIMTTLLAWHPHNFSNLLKDSSPKILPRHLKKATEFMQAYPDQIITIETLVNITGVNGRTLFYGFAKFLGLSPMRYLLDVRLQRVHQDLLDPSQPRNVTDVATRWGFYQLGRMASDYKKRYGESPRDTLIRAH